MSIAREMGVLFDAMYHGKYEFNDFITGDVSANFESFETKGGRIVHRPNKKLKAYHAFLNTFLFERMDVNERVVFSYRKGVNSHHAVYPHSNSRAFFRADIQRFFQSIDRDHVGNAIRARSSRVPISDLACHLERILDLTTVDGSLPIGFSTSPLISNVCLTGFDNDLERHCEEAGLLYTRYSDDILISGAHRDRLVGIESTVSDLLDRHFGEKLKLHAAKSKLTSIGRKVKVLGLVITPAGHVTIDVALKRHIEVMLHYYTSSREKFLDLSNNDMKAGLARLSGYINYINTADKHYLDKLRRKYGATVVDSFLHRSAV